MVKKLQADEKSWLAMKIIMKKLGLKDKKEHNNKWKQNKVAFLHQRLRIKLK